QSADWHCDEVEQCAPNARFVPVADAAKHSPTSSGGESTHVRPVATQPGDAQLDAEPSGTTPAGGARAAAQRGEGGSPGGPPPESASNWQLEGSVDTGGRPPPALRAMPGSHRQPLVDAVHPFAQTPWPPVVGRQAIAPAQPWTPGLQVPPTGADGSS